ncbi:MAG: hypothetical protein ACC656_02310, partial [Candidatus Heimdallarchaeota archaeon]
NQTLYSQPIFMNTNTSNVNLGIYNGNITIMDSIDTIKIPIQVIVQEAPSYRVLFDLKYTAADVGYTVYRAGYKTGTLIELINKDGGWVDLVDERFTTDLLEKYDVVWLPDPFGINAVEVTSITEQEIKVIQDYVFEGGNLFIHYFGKFNDSLANSVENSIVGTDITVLNNLLEPYGMSASNDLPDLNNYFKSEDNPSSQTIYNTTVLGEGVTKITSYQSTPIITSNGAVQVSSKKHLAAWSKPGKGRVLVSSTESWFASDNAINNLNSGDYRFMQNVVSWLTTYPRLEYTNFNITGNIVEIDVTVSNQTNYLDIPPKIQVISDFSDSAISNLPIVDVSNSGLGQYQYRIAIDEDGFYNVEISIPNDYLVFPTLIDTTGPNIKFLGNISEKYSQDDIIVHDISVTDEFSEIDEASIIIQIDTIKYSEFSFNASSSNLTLEFPSEFFDTGIQFVNIEVSDARNNTSQLQYNFKIINSNGINNSKTIAYLILLGLSIIVVIVVARYFIRNKK